MCFWRSLFGPARPQLEAVRPRVVVNAASVDPELIALSQPAVVLPPLVGVTAIEVWRAYHDNEVGAERTFGAKVLAVTGNLERVRRDGDAVVIVFALPGHPGRVEVEAGQAAADQLADWRPGQVVVVVGRVVKFDYERLRLVGCRHPDAAQHAAAAQQAIDRAA